MFDAIENDEPDYNLLANVSNEAKEFIQFALNKDARTRATIE
jgi:hypothetical protein